MISRILKPRFLATAMTACFLAALGCSDDGVGKRYSVSGTVTYNGNPLPKGSVTFVPDEPTARGGTGEIKNGSYSMMTQTPGDGMMPGTYSVTVSDLTVDFNSSEAETKKKLESMKLPTSGMVDPVAVSKAYKAGKDAVPAKYGQIATSGLKFTVKPESNKFDISLKD